MNGYFNYKDELYHHGVLGMKWGVRRYQPYGEGGYTPKEKRKSKFRNRVERSAGKKNTRALKEARSKDINELSTKELKEYNDRLQAEQNFQRLTEGNISSSKKWVTKTMTSIGTAIVTGLSIEAGKQFIKNNLGDVIKDTISTIFVPH